MRGFFVLLAVLLPLASSADSSLPFMKDLVGDTELPRPWGLSIDFYTMDQDYDVQNLKFELPEGFPPLVVDDPSLLEVTNDVMHFDIKGDVWLLPFLNVFGLVGKVDTDTVVDFSKANIIGLPFSKLPVSFDGTVYGGGFTLVYGTERWFTSATTTYTKSSISGDFKSTVDSISVQPRIGLIRDNWVFWAGGMYLDVDEHHSGVFDVPGIGEVDFAIDLITRDNWNYTAGIGHYFGDRANLSFEIGFGERTHTLFNFNVRF